MLQYKTIFLRYKCIYIYKDINVQYRNIVQPYPGPSLTGLLDNIDFRNVNY